MVLFASSVQLVIRFLPALLGVLLFVMIGVASLASLLHYADLSKWWGYLQEAYLWRIVRFSLWQALLSSVLSLVIAVPMASCFSHRIFAGKTLLLQLFAVSIVVPIIVVILGIVLIYGRSGWLSNSLGISVPLYGLIGILLAHVFFNMPLAVRLFLQGYSLIPAGQWRVASQLGLSRWPAFRLIELPYIRKVLPGAFLLIFMLCFSSFSVVLCLGGGPRSSTLEVAIYQALRSEFDLDKASFLSLLQVAICSLVAILVYKAASKHQQDFSLLKPQCYFVRDTDLARCCDFIVMMLALLLVLPPFIAIFYPIFSDRFLPTLLSEAIWHAVWVSLTIAFPAALLSLLLGGCFAVLARTTMDRGWWDFLPSKLEHLGSMVLTVPGLVLATGLFLLLRRLGVGLQSGYWGVIVVNGIMALPFVLRALLPVVYQQEKRFRNVYLSLGIHTWSRVKIEWPLVRKSVAQAFGYALLLSLGDVGVISLFGSQGLVSLPLYLFQLIGSYHSKEASCVAVVLITLCIILFYFSIRLIGGNSHVRD